MKRVVFHTSGFLWLRLRLRDRFVGHAQTSLFSGLVQAAFAFVHGIDRVQMLAARHAFVYGCFLVVWYLQLFHSHHLFTLLYNKFRLGNLLYNNMQYLSWMVLFLRQKSQCHFLGALL